MSNLAVGSLRADGAGAPVGDGAVHQDRLPWSVATVLGGTWGAVEISLGGFLHALHLPLVGLIMALFQVGFFVAVRRGIRQPGLLAFAGLVAAGVKFMVPSGAVFGPAIGIAVEGLLFEAAFFLFPGALAAFLAGCAAVLWVVGQMIATQVVFFGWNVLILYRVLFDTLGGAVGPGSAWWIGVVLLLGTAALGGGVGLWAWSLGRKLAQEVSGDGSIRVRRLHEAVEALFEELATKSTGSVGTIPRGGRMEGESSPVSATGRSPAWGTWLVAVVCVLAVATLAGSGFMVVFGLAGLTTAIVLWRPGLLRRLLRWRFWAAAFVVALATGMVLTLSRFGDSALSWFIGVSSATLILLGRVAVMTEVAVVTAHLVRPKVAGGKLAGFGPPGRALARAWAVVPAAMALMDGTLPARGSRDGPSAWSSKVFEPLVLWALVASMQTGTGDTVGRTASRGTGGMGEP